MISGASIHLLEYDMACYEVRRDWDGKTRICDSEFERDRSLYGRD
jgi:hypothetical protein